MPKQRLIVFFDGTWNDPVDQTNVYRMSRLVRDFDGDIEQRFFYDPGVGTNPFTRVVGGSLGVGLTKNLLEGYEWLVRRYREGDEIWIFGFSRGAYTARSLAGLISKCGLLHTSTPSLLKEAKKLYRDKDQKSKGPACTDFRDTYSRTPNIHFLGVWDTVGSLGIPGTSFSEFGHLNWHDTELSKIVERGYHAVALDEHRAAFDAALWVSEDGKQKKENLEIEQRWFIGAHANVGGGYPKTEPENKADPLPGLSLQWMVQKAQKAGLKLDDFSAETDAWKGKPTDSFSKFMNGVYAWYRDLRTKGTGKHIRNFSKGWKDKPAVNVTVDESVWMRWNDSSAHYKPDVLVKAGINPPRKPDS